MAQINHPHTFGPEERMGAQERSREVAKNKFGGVIEASATLPDDLAAVIDPISGTILPTKSTKVNHANALSIAESVSGAVIADLALAGYLAILIDGPSGALSPAQGANIVQAIGSRPEEGMGVCRCGCVRLTCDLPSVIDVPCVTIHIDGADVG